jgi:hypothetical protein
MADHQDNVTNDQNEQNEAPEANSPTGIRPEDVMAGGPDRDPVTEAYARTGRAAANGVSGIPASDEDAGEERRKLYESGATEVSRID